MQRFYDDPYEILRDMLILDRKYWIDIIKKYMSDYSDKKIIIDGYKLKPYEEKKNELILPPLKCFGENWQGQFNIGDYVTTKKYGGFYRILDYPVLDIRYIKERYDDLGDNWTFDFSNDIELSGDSYWILGINANLEKCTSDRWPCYWGYEVCQIPAPTDEDLIKIYPSKEIRNKINDFIYNDFEHRFGVGEMLKANEEYDASEWEIENCKFATIHLTKNQIIKKLNEVIDNKDDLVKAIISISKYDINYKYFSTKLGLDYYNFVPEQILPDYIWGDYKVGDIVTDGWDLKEVYALPPIKFINSNTRFTEDNIKDLLSCRYQLRNLITKDSKLISDPVYEFDYTLEKDFYKPSDEEIKEIFEIMKEDE